MTTHLLRGMKWGHQVREKETANLLGLLVKNGNVEMRGDLTLYYYEE